MKGQKVRILLFLKHEKYFFSSLKLNHIDFSMQRVGVLTFIIMLTLSFDKADKQLSL